MSPLATPTYLRASSTIHLPHRLFQLALSIWIVFILFGTVDHRVKAHPGDARNIQLLTKQSKLRRVSSEALVHVHDEVTTWS